MKATLLDDKTTPLTASDVVRAMREAYRLLLGYACEDSTLAIFVAQSALETGRWKSIHWFNFGNIKAGEDYEGFYTLFSCNEIINGKLQWFSPPNPQCRFRAYPSAMLGCADYLTLLRSRARFSQAWNAAHMGDPAAFVDALKAGGYFTADTAPYKRAVVSLTAEFSKLIADMGPATLAPPPIPEEHEHSQTSNEDMGRLLPLVWDETQFRADRDAEMRDKDEDS